MQGRVGLLINSVSGYLTKLQQLRAQREQGGECLEDVFSGDASEIKVTEFKNPLNHNDSICFCLQICVSSSYPDKLDLSLDPVVKKEEISELRLVKKTDDDDEVSRILYFFHQCQIQ